MSKKTQPEDKREEANFEEATAELEKIVRDLEDGQLGLAEAMQRYEQGVGLLKCCYQLLESAERRIELLSGVDADGNPIVEPFADDSTESLEEKSGSRVRRRSNPSARKKQAETDADSDDADDAGLF